MRLETVLHACNTVAWFLPPIAAPMVVKGAFVCCLQRYMAIWRACATSRVRLVESKTAWSIFRWSHTILRMCSIVISFWLNLTYTFKISLASVMVIFLPRNVALATSEERAPSISRILALIFSAKKWMTSSGISALSRAALCLMILTLVSKSGGSNSAASPQRKRVQPVVDVLQLDRPFIRCKDKLLAG